MIELIEKYDGYIIDLDGVIYLDKKPLSYSKTFINTLIKKNKNYVFLTNDSTLSPSQYTKILNREGIKCSSNQVITPINNFIETIRSKNKKTLAFCSKELRKFLIKEGLNIINNKNYKQAKNLLVSGNKDFSYDDLMYSSLCVQNGAKLYATSIDNSYPTKMGNVPATGSIIAAILKTHDTRVINLGKPSKEIFRLAINKLKNKKNKILTIGDNLNTDIQGSNDSGIDSLLVLTGKTNMKLVKESKTNPTYIKKNLKI